MKKTTISLENFKWDKTKTDFVPGNSSFKDRTGVKQGKLLPLYPIRKNKDTVWVCLCDCGRTVEVSNSNFSKVRSCSCGISRSGSNNPSWTGYESLHGGHLAGLRSSAEERGILYEVTPEYLWELYQKQEGLCALTGQNISIDKGGSKKTASLDRIDSKEGYVEGNVQWVHKDLNLMKRSYSQEYFLELCGMVAKFHNLIK